MMSKTESFLILDSQNAATVGDIAKKAARMHPQSVVRKKLADISNLPQNQRLLIHEEKSRSTETTTKEYIDQLQKENMALRKMLAQRNKIIEQSGVELDRLRVNMLKMQEQNQQLALSNSQMLVELNSGKERLRVLQHELGCKSGLLKARKLVLEEKTRKRPCKNSDAELVKFREQGEPSKESKEDEKPHKTKSNSLGSSQVHSKNETENKRPFVRRQSARFKAADLEPAEDLFEADDTKVHSKEETKNKRPFVRRQSARFKAADIEPAEDLFEAGDTKVPGCLLPEKLSTSESASVENEDNKDIFALRYEPLECGRTSLRRPSRIAAKKVQSYKEIPLNVKMRRPE